MPANVFLLLIKPKTMKKIFLRVLVTLVILLVLAIAYFVVFVYYKPHVDYARAEPEMEISAERLFHDFLEDPVEAYRLYGGKVLLVDGVVDDIERADDMVIAVMLFEEGFFGPEGVRFTMLEGHQEHLVIGRHMQIKGLCTGYTGDDEWGGDVLIEHASVPQGP